MPRSITYLSVRIVQSLIVLLDVSKVPSRSMAIDCISYLFSIAGSMSQSSVLCKQASTREFAIQREARYIIGIKTGEAMKRITARETIERVDALIHNPQTLYRGSIINKRGRAPSRNIPYS